MNSAAYGRDINQEQWLTQLMEDHGTGPRRHSRIRKGLACAHRGQHL